MDALRALMVEGGQSVMGYGLDAAVEVGTLVLLIAVAAKLYPTTVN